MWASLFVTYCAVYLAQATETNHIYQDLGPLHIHVNTTNVPLLPHPQRWDDKHATRKAITLINLVRSLPNLNPFKAEYFGPYDATIPDILFYGNIFFKNIVVTGINNLCLQSFEMQLSPPRIYFNATISKITVEAGFDLDAEYSFLPVNNHGHFNVTLLGLTVSAEIGPRSAYSYTVPVYQLETAVVTIDLKDVQIQMNLDQYAEEYKIILNNFANNTEDLIIDNDVLDLLLKGINHELDEIPAEKIVNYLLSTSRPNLKQLDPSSKRKTSRKYGK